MKTAVRRAMSLGVVAFLAWQGWTHRHALRLSALVAPETKTIDKAPAYAEQEQAKGMVTVVGPLSDALKPENAGNDENDRKDQLSSHETLASDHVGPSPVGTDAVLLHKTLRLARVVDVPFDLPAHAFSPRLHGSYRGFPKDAEDATDEPGSVQFLLLTEEQYQNLVLGRPAEALLTADATDEQEVNFIMPPTFEQPTKYHMVFRNNSARPQVVQADFRVDF